METCLKAEKLVAVTHLAEEERQKPNQANPGTALLYSGSARVAAAQAKILETGKREFLTKNPGDESSLRNRFEVMGAMLEMLKMRFLSNPTVATASLPLMKEYADWLCGEKVWGFVVMGPDGLPLASPHIGHVLQYDQAIQNLQHRLMKEGTLFDGRSRRR